MNAFVRNNTFILSRTSKRDCVVLEGVGTNPFIDAANVPVVVRDGLFIASEKDRALAESVASRRGLVQRIKLAWRVLRERSDYAVECSE